MVQTKTYQFRMYPTIEQVVYKYYVSVCVENEIICGEKKEDNFVGIDVGVKELVVTSDNEIYENPNYAYKYGREIKGLQKSLSRKNKGSKNYQKTIKKLQETYRKLKNVCKKYVEKVVAKVTESNDIIVAEKLKIQIMVERKNNSKTLRKRITNATFGKY